jgi:hypothetical protein
MGVFFLVWGVYIALSFASLSASSFSFSPKRIVIFWMVIGHCCFMSFLNYDFYEVSARVVLLSGGVLYMVSYYVTQLSS